MDTTRLAAVALAVLTLAGSTPAATPAMTDMRAGAGDALVQPKAAPALSVAAGSDEDRALVEWAASRFAEAGLELPPIVIDFIGPSLSSCGGAQATARLALDPVVISVCWGSPFVLLHELAHVWEAESVTSDQQGRFMRTRTGVASWANPDDSWVQQGREHAANVIAWALAEDPVVVGRTYPNDRTSLEVGFEILTGRGPLHHEGGEPILVDRSEFELATAKAAASHRDGIRSGR